MVSIEFGPLDSPNETTHKVSHAHPHVAHAINGPHMARRHRQSRIMHAGDREYPHSLNAAGVWDSFGQLQCARHGPVFFVQLLLHLEPRNTVLSRFGILRRTHPTLPLCSLANGTSCNTAPPNIFDSTGESCVHASDAHRVRCPTSTRHEGHRSTVSKPQSVWLRLHAIPWLHPCSLLVSEPSCP